MLHRMIAKGLLIISAASSFSAIADENNTSHQPQTHITQTGEHSSQPAQMETVTDTTTTHHQHHTDTFNSSESENTVEDMD